MVSYADGVREELVGLPLKKPCCRRSLAAGLLLLSEQEGKRVTVRYKQALVADHAEEVLARQFGKAPERRSICAYGHTTYELTLLSASAARLIEGMREAENAAVYSNHCEGCRSAFLRGTFLAAGTVNDPRKSTHMEFLTYTSSQFALLSAFFAACGYAPGVSKRKQAEGLYFKDCGSVEDLLALSGASRAAMDMMNVRIEREIRNQENRATNCVAKNIEKSVSAASRQMAAIEKLTVTGMLAQLPESVRATALLRAENPDATLEELRNLHTPPITKSGLNHRLQKIVAEAEKL